MKRIKLTDVARVAGVSTSTVDRVLNRRPGVRADTYERVEAALRQLGYAPTSVARRLSDLSQVATVLLPGGGTQVLERLRRALAAEAELRSGDGADIRRMAVSPFGPTALVHALDSISEDVSVVVTALAEAHEVTESVARLEERGVRVIAVLTDAPSSGRERFVGVDNYAAGRTAGALMARFLPPGTTEITLLAGDPLQREHHDRRSGFEQAITRLRPEVSVTSAGACRNDPAEARRLLLRALTQRARPGGVYVIGDAHTGVIQALDEAGDPLGPVVAHDLSPASRSGLLSGRYTAIVAQDIPELARLAFTAALRPDIDLPQPQPYVVLPENMPPA